MIKSCCDKTERHWGSVTVLGRLLGVVNKKAVPIKTTEVVMFCNQSHDKFCSSVLVKAVIFS